MPDFYEMTVAVMKTSFQKLQAKRVKCRNYKAFLNKIYREDLISKLSNENSDSEPLDKSSWICINVLNQHVPCQTKMLRGNQCPFMNKDLAKAMITKTRLRNKFLKNRREENRKFYTQQ